MHDRKPFTVFSSEFLERMAEREGEPLSAYEAALSGPWSLERHGGRYAVLQRGGDGPEALVEHRETALLLAAAFPLTSRGRRYWCDEAPGGGHLALVLRGLAGESAPADLGRLRHNDDEVLATLSSLDHLVRSPLVMSYVLEATSIETLRRAGNALARRWPDDEP